MAPYLAEHLSHAALGSADGALSISSTEIPNFARDSPPSREDSSPAGTSPGTTSDRPVSSSSMSCPSPFLHFRCGGCPRTRLHCLLSCAKYGVRAGEEGIWNRVGAWAAGARHDAVSIAFKWRPAWAVLASYAPVAVRLHLALFYFYGVYYHWAKRATGAPAYCIQRSPPCLVSDQPCQGSPL